MRLTSLHTSTGCCMRLHYPASSASCMARVTNGDLTADFIKGSQLPRVSLQRPGYELGATNSRTETIQCRCCYTFWLKESKAQGSVDSDIFIIDQHSCSTEATEACILVDVTVGPTSRPRKPTTRALVEPLVIEYPMTNAAHGRPHNETRMRQ
jgi:hypothetical protein